MFLHTSIVFAGLPSHPQYELGKRQMIGYSGMVVFYIKGGLKESREFFQNVKVITLTFFFLQKRGSESKDWGRRKDGEKVKEIHYIMCNFLYNTVDSKNNMIFSRGKTHQKNKTSKKKQTNPKSPQKRKRNRITN